MITTQDIEKAFYEDYPTQESSHKVEHRFAFHWRKDAWLEGAQWAIDQLVKTKSQKSDVLDGQLSLFGDD